MKRWISRAACAYEREPGLCLLAAGVATAVLFWHLPVPAFLFADPGSGSAARCVCGEPKDCLSAWGNYMTPGGKVEPGLFEGGGKLCELKDTCPQDCKLACSEFIYEEAGAGKPGCQNGSTSQGACLGPPHTKTDCNWSQWARKVEVPITTKGSGTPRISFHPVVKVEFPGFSDSNVCVGSTGQFEVWTGCIATLEVCGKTGLYDRDPDRDGDEENNKNSAGENGWYFAKHVFLYDKMWKFGEGGPSAFEFNVNVKMGEADPDVPHLCPCTVFKYEPIERVRFSVTVSQNGGVKFGRPGAGQSNAAIRFYVEKCDATRCAVE